MTECACCGQTLPPDLPKGLKLRGRRLDIYNIVRRAGQNGITSDVIFERLYALDPNGGPDSGVRVVSIMICHLNKRLQPFGQKVQGGHTGNGCYGEYRLVTLNA